MIYIYLSVYLSSYLFMHHSFIHSYSFTPSLLHSFPPPTGQQLPATGAFILFPQLRLIGGLTPLLKTDRWSRPRPDHSRRPQSSQASPAPPTDEIPTAPPAFRMEESLGGPKPGPRTHAQQMNSVNLWAGWENESRRRNLEMPY